MPSYLQIIQVKGQRMTVARDEQDEGVLERGGRADAAGALVDTLRTAGA
jgi:hypothetical protein